MSAGLYSLLISSGLVIMSAILSLNKKQLLNINFILFYGKQLCREGKNLYVKP